MTTRLDNVGGTGATPQAPETKPQTKVTPKTREVIEFPKTEQKEDEEKFKILGLTIEPKKTNDDEITLPEEEIETSEEVNVAVPYVVVGPRPEIRYDGPIGPALTNETKEIKDDKGKVTRTETRDPAGRLLNTTDYVLDAAGNATKSIEKTYSRVSQYGNDVALTETVIKGADGKVIRSFKFTPDHRFATRFGADGKKLETLTLAGGKKVSDRTFYDSNEKVSQHFSISVGTGEIYVDSKARDPYELQEQYAALSRNDRYWKDSGIEDKMFTYDTSNPNYLYSIRKPQSSL